MENMTIEKYIEQINIHRRTPNRLYKLSEMSRSYNTTMIAGRLCADGGCSVPGP